MTNSVGSFTVTTLVAAAAEILERAGFRVVGSHTVHDWRATASRIYEDPYSVVCVAVYETWEDLFDRWVDDQATLVRLISEYFTRTDPKAWDGYLVLLTPSVVRASDQRDAGIIQRDTLHLRKLLAVREGFSSVGAVRETLLPLLPIEEQAAPETVNALDSLPALLATRGIDAEAVQVAVAAFRDQRPIVAEVNAYLESKLKDQR